MPRPAICRAAWFDEASRGTMAVQRRWQFVEALCCVEVRRRVPPRSKLRALNFQKVWVQGFGLRTREAAVAGTHARYHQPS